MRSIMLLATPLVVACGLLWQRQSVRATSETGDAAASVVQGGPPAGISSEEWEAAGLEFEALTDSTLRCSAEEMPAYWRLLKWSVQQPDGGSERNRFSRVAFNELVNRPNRHRGAPVQVDLHICRIVSYAAPDNGLGIERLYEVWGWSDDSRGSLYVAITPELPPGMQTGEKVSERGTLLGYFYKVQGYLAAGSAPQACPSAAPLMIGRLERWTGPATVVAKTNELWPAAGGLLLAASFVWLLSHRPLFRSRHRESVAQLASNATAKLETWLDLEGRLEPQLQGETRLSR